MSAQILRFGATIGPGEEKTSRLLARELPDDWTIVCNKVVRTDRASDREIDFIVIGRHGVYVIDEKSWSGRIIAEEGCWILQNGKEVHPPDAKTAVTASILAVQMKGSIPTLRKAVGTEYFLWGYVLLSSRRASLVTRNDSLYDRVLHLKDAARTLMDKDASHAGGPGDIEACRPDIIDWFGRPPSPEAMQVTRWRRWRWRVVAASVVVVLLAAVTAVLLVSRAASGDQVPWQAAGQYVGQSVTVQGPVVDSSNGLKSRAASGDQVPWQAAGQYVGQSVTVQGPVVDSSGGFRYVFLNIGEPYRAGDSSGFVVWLDIGSLGQSADQLRAAYPAGAVVAVQGAVGTDRDGRPKIVVTDPDAISTD